MIRRMTVAFCRNPVMVRRMTVVVCRIVFEHKKHLLCSFLHYYIGGVFTLRT